MAKTTKTTHLEGYYAYGEGDILFFDFHATAKEHERAPKEVPCRSPGSDLIDPAMRGRRGTWTITVEFEPYEVYTN